MLKAPPLIPQVYISKSSKIGLKKGRYKCSKICLIKVYNGRAYFSNIFYVPNITKLCFFKFRTDIVLLGPTMTL